jgi:hypothetical protein
MVSRGMKVNKSTMSSSAADDAVLVVLASGVSKSPNNLASLVWQMTRLYPSLIKLTPYHSNGSDCGAYHHKCIIGAKLLFHPYRSSEAAPSAQLFPCLCLEVISMTLIVFSSVTKLLQLQ